MEKSLLVRSLVAVVLLGSAFTAQAAITRVEEKTFTVKPEGLLKAVTSGGSITVRSDDSPLVRVVVTKHVNTDDEDDADEALEDLELTMEQHGDEIFLNTHYERHRLFGFWFGSTPQVRVSYTVSVPRNFALQLSTSGGNITVTDTAGSISARTSGGNLQFEGVEGAVDANTSGGNIRASWSKPPSHDVVLKTSGGNVRVEVPEHAGFELDASTSGGVVSTSGLEVSDRKRNKNRSRLSGTVNDGGPSLILRTSGGNIRVAAE